MTSQMAGWLLLGLIMLSLTIINLTTPSKDDTNEH
jgi:hypothetical protein